MVSCGFFVFANMSWWALLELGAFFLVVANVDNRQTGAIRDINELLPVYE